MKKSSTKDPEDFAGAFESLEPPERRKTDDDLPAEEAALAIKQAAEDRKAARQSSVDMRASVEIQKTETFDLYEQVRTGKPMDFDRLRKGRRETRAGAAARLAAERNLDWEQQVKIEDHDTYQYALLCPHCSKPAIFFARNPLGKVLYNDDWFSALKKQDDTWHMDMIPCQQCFIDTGTYMGICINKTATRDPKRGQAFTVSGAFSRLVVKFAKDPERRQREGILDAMMDRVRKIGVATQEEAQSV